MGKKIEINLNEILHKVKNGESLTNIAAYYGMHRATLGRKLRIVGLDIKMVKFNHNYFEIIDTEEKAYWLGFLMADGCVNELMYKGKISSKRIILCINEKDYEHLLKFNKALESLNKISKSNDKCVRTTHTSQKMFDDLKNLGCVPNKSLTLKFPNLKENLVRHFIRGYIDGDGCISFKHRDIKNNRNNAIHSIVLSFMGTLDVMNKLSLYFKIKNKYRKHGKNTYSTAIAGNNKAMKILDWLYTDATIYLERKYKLYKEHKTKLENRDPNTIRKYNQ